MNGKKSKVEDKKAPESIQILSVSLLSFYFNLNVSARVSTLHYDNSLISKLDLMRSYFVFTLILANPVIPFDVEPYPTFRFREYSELSSEQKTAATSLGYTKTSWNKPGTTDVEYLSWWYNVNMDYYDADKDGDYYEANPEFEIAAKILGFVGDEAEDVWVSSDLILAVLCYF